MACDNNPPDYLRIEKYHRRQPLNSPKNIIFSDGASVTLPQGANSLQIQGELKGLGIVYIQKMYNRELSSGMGSFKVYSNNISELESKVEELGFKKLKK